MHVQLAKALLAGNVRGQLTTVMAGQTAAEESKVTSTVASYLSPRGAHILGRHKYWADLQLACCQPCRFGSFAPWLACRQDGSLLAFL
jgi:hypothetical protein